MKQKYKVFRRDISPHLIIISLRVVYFIQRQQKKLVNESDISGFINNSVLNEKKYKHQH